MLSIFDLDNDVHVYILVFASNSTQVLSSMLSTSLFFSMQ